MTTGNGYEVEDAAPIPTDLQTAITLARGSEWLKAVMGDDMYELAMQQSERELEFFSAQVTDVETARYLGSF